MEIGLEIQCHLWIYGEFKAFVPPETLSQNYKSCLTSFKACQVTKSEQKIKYHLCCHTYVHNIWQILFLKFEMWFIFADALRHHPSTRGTDIM